MTKRVLLAPFTGAIDVLECKDVIHLDLGYEVDTKYAHNIHEASGPYDLIVQMGLGPEREKSDGLAYVRDLRRRFPEAPILVISGHHPAYGLPEVQACGANDFLERSKYLTSTLVAVVERLIHTKPAG